MHAAPKDLSLTLFWGRFVARSGEDCVDVIKVPKASLTDLAMTQFLHVHVGKVRLAEITNKTSSYRCSRTLEQDENQEVRSAVLLTRYAGQLI